MSRFSRITLLRALVPGLLLGAIGLAGCKDPNANKAGGESGGNSTSTAASQKLDVETIKIGQYASLTGETSTFGKESDAGLSFAIEEIGRASCRERVCLAV